MKIGNPALGIHDAAPAATPGAARTAPEEASKALPGLAADSAAKVELSATATVLMSGIKGAPAEFDAGKVQRISQAIADGSFRVDPDAIADKLIANAQELLGSIKR